jgi:hypothetical protein
VEEIHPEIVVAAEEVTTVIPETEELVEEDN